MSGDITLLTPIFEGSAGKELLEDDLLPSSTRSTPTSRSPSTTRRYGKLNDKLTTAVASGLVPDVMLMGVGWIENFAKTRRARRPLRASA